MFISENRVVLYALAHQLQETMILQEPCHFRLKYYEFSNRLIHGWFLLACASLILFYLP